MASDRTSLGDRMKRYETVTRQVLPRRVYTVIRVDGRAFHTYLRGAERPFDLEFMRAMDAVAAALIEEVSGAVFAYVQSDEVSVLVQDFVELNQEPWFGGVVAKQVSIAASVATAALNKRRGREKWGLFDARVFTMADQVEVANYFLWRQRDAVRNSIAMTAQTYFSHQALDGVNTDQMKEMLLKERSVDWNEMPAGFRYGRVAERVEDQGRTKIEVRSAPQMTADPYDWLASVVPALPRLAWT